MDADGKNMKKLSDSPLSEASPCVLPDGRIMYTRWEYNDKGAISVKWSLGHATRRDRLERDLRQ